MLKEIKVQLIIVNYLVLLKNLKSTINNNK